VLAWGSEDTFERLVHGALSQQGLCPSRPAQVKIDAEKEIAAQ
jgi:hypothetical protein